MQVEAAAKQHRYNTATAALLQACSKSPTKHAFFFEIFSRIVFLAHDECGNVMRINEQCSPCSLLLQQAPHCYLTAAAAAAAFPRRLWRKCPLCRWKSLLLCWCCCWNRRAKTPDENESTSKASSQLSQGYHDHRYCQHRTIPARLGPE